jgi:hypothetical protein
VTVRSNLSLQPAPALQRAEMIRKLLDTRAATAYPVVT